jgi:hypothetical protein
MIVEMPAERATSKRDPCAPGAPSIVMMLTLMVIVLVDPLFHAAFDHCV